MIARAIGCVGFDPRFHESEDAKASLLRWLSGQPYIVRTRFLLDLAVGTNYKGQVLGRQGADLTATPEEVAEAAYMTLTHVPQNGNPE